MGSRRRIIDLQQNWEVGRYNTIPLVLNCYLSLGPKELSCGPVRRKPSQQHPAKLCRALQRVRNVAIFLVSAKRFRRMPQELYGVFFQLSSVMCVGKTTPDFPSESSKFLGLENYVCTLAARTNCGKWISIRDEGEDLFWGWGGEGGGGGGAKAEGFGVWLGTSMELSKYGVGRE